MKALNGVLENKPVFHDIPVFWKVFVFLFVSPVFSNLGLEAGRCKTFPRCLKLKHWRRFRSSGEAFNKTQAVGWWSLGLFHLSAPLPVKETRVCQQLVFREHVATKPEQLCDYSACRLVSLIVGEKRTRVASLTSLEREEVRLKHDKHFSWVENPDHLICRTFSNSEFSVSASQKASVSERSRCFWLCLRLKLQEKSFMKQRTHAWGQPSPVQRKLHKTPERRRLYNHLSCSEDWNCKKWVNISFWRTKVWAGHQTEQVFRQI